jgi:phosphate transport system substrate-binding protein
MAAKRLFIWLGDIMKMKLVSLVTMAAMVAGVSPVVAQHLTGAGGTFPNPIYQRWFTEYSHEPPGVQIDGPMNDKQLSESKQKLIHIPTVLGAVVPAYNLPGINTELKFSGDVIADIYLGKITKWNDSRISRDNPGVNLPDHTILPVYRSDGSGTNYIFTDYLSKVSPAFKQKIGSATSVEWPLGVGQKGNEGVAGMIRNSPFSFGYVELIYAVQNHMLFGQVKNADGHWIKASTESVSAAAAGAAKNMPADYRVSITNAPGANAYPISSFTWLLIPNPSKDSAKGKVLHDFLEWMLDHGEAEAASMTYAPLPPAIAARVRKTVEMVH